MVQQRLPIVNSDDGTWGDILRQYLMKEHYDDGTDNAVNGGHQKITIRAGTATAGTAPLKFTSGTLLTTPEAGAMEFAGDGYYLTQTTGTTRKKIAAYDDTSGATGDIYYRDASGYFTRLPIGSSNYVLTVSSGLPSWQPATGGTTLPVADTTAVVKNATDNTKQLKFDLSGLTTATTRTLTVPDADMTLVGTATTQTLTNKTISGSSNTLSNLPQDQLTTTNLLTTNPWFATDISGWSQDGTNSFTWDGTTGRTANGSATITAGSTNRYFSSTNISITPGKKYIIGGWVKTSSYVVGSGAISVGVNEFNAFSYVDFVNPKGSTVSTPSGTWNAIYSSGSYDWTFLGGVYTAPTSGVDQIGVSFNVSGTSGTVWIDDTVIASANIDQTWVSGLAYSLDSIISNAQNAAQTLQNKTLDNSNVATLKDSNFTLQDDGDTTKQLKFQLSGITTGNTRTLTVPDANTTLVGTDTAQTLTGKTISGASNTLSSIGVSALSATGTPSSSTYLRGDNTWATVSAGTSTPTASTTAQWDSNTNMSADAFIQGTTSTATAAGTTTLDINSTQVQVFTGTTTQTVKLPTTSVAAGQTYTIINQSSGAVTVQSSGANTIATQAANTVGVYTAEIAAPTAATDWVASVTTKGKVLTANNSLTLAGTDSTTMTFPSTSGNVIASSTGIGTVTGTPSSSTYLRGDGTWSSAGTYNPQISSTATAAGTTTLTNSSNQVQVFTGTTTQTVVLPTTSVTAGSQWEVLNQSTGAVTVNASGGATVVVVAAGTSALFTAAINTPTAATDWDCQYGGIAVTSGKSLSVQNSLTISAPDGASVMLGGAQSASVTTSETTSSTTYADLTTTTDQVTVTIGASGMAQVFIQAQMSNTGQNYSYLSFALSGANTVAAVDTNCIQFVNPSAGWQSQYAAPFLLTGLSAGSTTFKMKYKVNAGTTTFANRRISVIPL